MTEEKIAERSAHDLPYGRTVKFQNIVHDGGLTMLRMTIREGRRFTIIDLDQKSAHALGADLTDWATSTTE